MSANLCALRSRPHSREAPHAPSACLFHRTIRALSSYTHAPRLPSRASLVFVSFSGPATRQIPRDSRRAPRHFHACVPRSNSLPNRLWYDQFTYQQQRNTFEPSWTFQGSPSRPRNLFVRRRVESCDSLLDPIAPSSARTHVHVIALIQTLSVLQQSSKTPYPYQYFLPL